MEGQPAAATLARVYVTRCVCHRRTFRELLRFARERRVTTVAALIRTAGVGTGCGSCRPYLAAMLATGADSFAVAAPDEPPVPARPPPGWEP